MKLDINLWVIFTISVEVLLPKNSYFTDSVLNYDQASEGCEFCCVEQETSCWLGWGEDLVDSGEKYIGLELAPPE